MNIIPLISIRKGLLLDGKDGNQLSIEQLFNQVKKETMLYVHDLDGIEHNNPSLDLYQRLTEHCILWIDDGPRRLDDVMDTIMAGATNITLREELWPEIDLPGVFEITDDEVYIGIKSIYNQQSLMRVVSSQYVGVVVFNKEPRNNDFISTKFLKDLALKHKIYLYTNAQNNLGQLETYHVTGVLVDLNKKEGYHHGF